MTLAQPSQLAIASSYCTPDHPFSVVPEAVFLPVLEAIALMRGRIVYALPVQHFTVRLYRSFTSMIGLQSRLLVCSVQ